MRDSLDVWKKQTKSTECLEHRIYGSDLKWGWEIIKRQIDKFAYKTFKDFKLRSKWNILHLREKTADPKNLVIYEACMPEFSL